MKLTALITVIIALSGSALASSQGASDSLVQQEVADVGFHDSRFYIHTAFESPLMEIIFQFSLCNVDSQSCTPINICKYSETEIRSSLDQIVDPRIRYDLDWFFYRSDYSQVTLEEFFPAFKNLLNAIDAQRGRNDCGIDKLESLKDTTLIKNG